MNFWDMLAVVLFLPAMFVFVLLLPLIADLITGFADPRTRKGKKRDRRNH